MFVTVPFNPIFNPIFIGVGHHEQREGAESVQVP
jgi:hypothetical protein